MLITSIASEYWPQTGEGKILCLILSIYGFCVFGYITAMLASFFVGRDAEEEDAPLASADDIRTLQEQIHRLTEVIQAMQNRATTNQ
jgi:voltage-gated potassium channel